MGQIGKISSEKFSFDIGTLYLCLTTVKFINLILCSSFISLLHSTLASCITDQSVSLPLSLSTALSTPLACTVQPRQVRHLCAWPVMKNATCVLTGRRHHRALRVARMGWGSAGNPLPCTLLVLAEAAQLKRICPRLPLSFFCFLFLQQFHFQFQLLSQPLLNALYNHECSQRRRVFKCQCRVG